MSYNTISLMARDGDLRQRLIACAAQEGIDNPDAWVNANIWQLVVDTDAVASYQYAVDGDHDQIGQYGKRTDVIADAKLLGMVQARHAVAP